MIYMQNYTDEGAELCRSAQPCSSACEACVIAHVPVGISGCPICIIADRMAGGGYRMIHHLRCGRNSKCLVCICRYEKKHPYHMDASSKICNKQCLTYEKVHLQRYAVKL